MTHLLSLYTHTHSHTQVDNAVIHITLLNAIHFYLNINKGAVSFRQFWFDNKVVFHLREGVIDLLLHEAHIRTLVSKALQTDWTNPSSTPHTVRNRTNPQTTSEEHTCVCACSMHGFLSSHSVCLKSCFNLLIFCSIPPWRTLASLSSAYCLRSPLRLTVILWGIE